MIEYPESAICTICEDRFQQSCVDHPFIIETRNSYAKTSIRKTRPLLKRDFENFLQPERIEKKMIILDETQQANLNAIKKRRCPREACGGLLYADKDRFGTRYVCTVCARSIEMPRGF